MMWLDISGDFSSNKLILAGLILFDKNQAKQVLKQVPSLFDLDDDADLSIREIQFPGRKPKP